MQRIQIINQTKNFESKEEEGKDEEVSPLETGAGILRPASLVDNVA